MNLALPCWECQRLWQQGYSNLPSCFRCARENSTDSDYSDSQSLQRRYKTTYDYEQPFSATMLNINLNKMSMSAQLENETMTYFNLYIAPDFAPTSTDNFQLTDLQWQKWCDITKTLMTCTVATHKTFRGLGNNDVFVLENKALATRELNSLVQRSSQGPLYAQLMDAMTMFINFEIQQSSYGAWRVHLNGAKSLLDSCPEALLGCERDDVHFLAIVDIYGTTTTPSRLLSPEMVAHHKFYQRMFALSDIDPLETPSPIPDEILDAMVAINIYRIEQQSEKLIVRERQSSLDDIMSCLDKFDPHKWASGLSAKYKHFSKRLCTLATCYSSATLLYLLQSCHIHSTNKSVRWKLDVRRQAAYRDLKNAITTLFKERTRNGTFYKIIFWPIVICGIEMVAQGGRPDFLCDNLEMLTVELGTNGMREAAAFLKDLVELRQSRDAKPGETFEFDWDEIFARAPIFAF